MAGGPEKSTLAGPAKMAGGPTSNTPTGRAKIQEVRKRAGATPQPPVLLTVLKGLEDTRTSAMKAPLARAPLAATITEELREASPPAGVRASAAVVDMAVVDIDDRINGEMPHAANESESRQMVQSHGA
jgi:hypothetical protein